MAVSQSIKMVMTAAIPSSHSPSTSAPSAALVTIPRNPRRSARSSLRVTQEGAVLHLSSARLSSPQTVCRTGGGNGGGTGGGVLDKPGVVIDKPDIGSLVDKEVGKQGKKKQAPPYKVLLHNDDFNRREYVVQVLMKVIPAMTLDVAVNVMQEAHVNGMATVIVCGREEAEEYCESLRNNGLISSIEPQE